MKNCTKYFFRSCVNFQCEAIYAYGKVCDVRVKKDKPAKAVLMLSIVGNSHWTNILSSSLQVACNLAEYFRKPKYSMVLNTSHGTLNQDTLNVPQNIFIPTWSLSKKFACLQFQPGLKPSL